MKASQTYFIPELDLPARRALQGCLAAVLVILIGIGWDVAIGQTQPPDADAPGAQVLTRGPVHEAFAGTITFNPEPGVVVTKAPPDGHRRSAARGEAGGRQCHLDSRLLGLG